MGQALYRKYRSKSLPEIVGQEHIVSTLQNALKQGRISHAYLFTGPHGVGKTSVARILAHQINQLPYDDESSHLDIIEIDAASNRRIDEIRDLRDKVHIAPSIAKYKVYIIDEVHMLTKEAFNALLKTLEEPPAHVVFILATTEINKLPETIISRTQRFTFRSLETDEVARHLKTIAEKEGIKIDGGALTLLAEAGNGSFRDSISLLDQLSSYSAAGASINAEDVQHNLGLASQEVILRLLDDCLTAEPKQVVEHLQAAYRQGHEASHLTKQLGNVIRQRLGTARPSDAAQLVDLLAKLIEVPSSADPSTALLVVLLGVNLANTRPDKQVTEPAAKQQPTVAETPSTPPKTKKIAEVVVAKPPTVVSQQIPKVESKENPDKITASPPVDVDFDQAWQQVLQSVKKTHNTLYGVLRMAQVTQDTESEKTPIAVLSCQFAFHQKRLNEPKNKIMIGDLLAQATGGPIKLECRLIDKTKSEVPPSSHLNKTPATNTDGDLSAISNIFGSAEVLES